MSAIFTMSLEEFKNIQKVESVNVLLKKYDVSPMPNNVNVLGFCNK